MRHEGNEAVRQREVRALARQNDVIDYAEAYRRTGSHVAARKLVKAQYREVQARSCVPAELCLYRDGERRSGTRPQRFARTVRRKLSAHDGGTATAAMLQQELLRRHREPGLNAPRTAVRRRTASERRRRRMRRRCTRFGPRRRRNGPSRTGRTRCTTPLSATSPARRTTRTPRRRTRSRRLSAARSRPRP